MLDWVQYRRNFRAPVMVRPFGRVPAPDPGGLRPMRRWPRSRSTSGAPRTCPTTSSCTTIVDRLSKALGLIPDVHECIHLEDWVRPSKSVIWSFNRSYWRHLARVGRHVPEGLRVRAARRRLRRHQPRVLGTTRSTTFMQTLDRLDEWSELPDEIHVLEFGVGDGQQAKVWLDTFARALRGARPRLPGPASAT